MTRSKRRRCPAPAAVTVVALAALAAFAADYSVYVVDLPVNNRPVLPGKPLPPARRPGTEFQITACRGEYEPVLKHIIRTQLAD